ncbi:hypothetical protein AB4Y30_10775 [Ornithinibacillus sp. 4-3]|uniref:Aminotransferase class V-fold PLP-dependent enzyme n=1 Tax=Ornithinibacillus sp. 4-3 TaxID=3231488 RepID=A0AB39HMP0_9BACI
MNIYEELGIPTLINAQDSETRLGGSRLPEEIRQKMNEASPYFVKIAELEIKLSERIAQMTNNDSCLITNGASAGLAISVAGCITRGNEKFIQQLPSTDQIPKNEAIMFKAQRNNYDNAIRLSGAKLIEIESNKEDLVSSISRETACIVYFAGDFYESKAIPFLEVVEIAKKFEIPLIVDAAANLPPVSNLWFYTKQGADLVVFSGGKTLRGPQASGLILGKETWINYCRLNSSPNKSIGRPMKVGKEEMIGIFYALDRYLKLDHAKEKKSQENMLDYMIEKIEKSIPDVSLNKIYPAHHGQDYSRLKIEFDDSMRAKFYKNELEKGKNPIIINLSSDSKALIINPLHLEESEVAMIITKLTSLMHTKSK